MPRGQAPLFLERRSYRQRRLRDAARLLPVLGLGLWLLPLLFAADGEPATTSQALIYIFTVWVVLAGIAAWLSQRMDMDPGPDEPGPWSDARPAMPSSPPVSPPPVPPREAP